MKSALRNIFILLLIAATLAVIYWLVISYYDEKNRTDDAQVDGNIVPVLARTDGFVDTIFADDDQYIDAGTMYMCNTNYWNLVVHSKVDFVTTEFIRPSNQMVKVAFILWRGNQTTNNRRRFGKLVSIS